MLVDVIRAEYIEANRIHITFENGVSGVVDFTKYRNQGGVFEKLKDDHYFRSFIVDEAIGTISWFGVVDIAPETLYDDVLNAQSNELALA